MNFFENLNIFKNDNQVIGLKSFRLNEKKEVMPTVYTGNYALSMFKINLDKRINQTVGQNLYFLS